MDKARAKAWLAEVITDAAVRSGGQSGLARALGRSRNTISAWKFGANDPSWLDVVALCRIAEVPVNAEDAGLPVSGILRVIANATAGPARLEERIAALEAQVAAFGPPPPVVPDFGSAMDEIIAALGEQKQERKSREQAAKRKKRSA